MRAGGARRTSVDREASSVDSAATVLVRAQSKLRETDRDNPSQGGRATSTARDREKEKQDGEGGVG